jgi:hypothetical protein
MSSDRRVSEPVDERSIAKKYGIRELAWPGSDQVKALTAFLSDAIRDGRCGAIPRTAVAAVLEFVQGTINRQHITKGPRMSAEEFDALQAPYYFAARIVSRIQRAREEGTKGRVYQTTWVSLSQFSELLRQLSDPSCFWVRSRSIPASSLEAMEALVEFLETYREQRRKALV